MGNTEENFNSVVIRINEFEKRLDERSATIKEALVLQAREYERRLDGMNGHNEKIASISSEQVRRDVFDKVVEDFNRRISAAENFKSNIEGRIWGIVAASVIFNFLVTAILTGLTIYFLKK